MPEKRDEITPLSRHVHLAWRWDTGSLQTQQLWPLSVTKSEYRRSYRWELNKPPYLALELLLAGELLAEIDGKSFVLKPGDLLLIPKPEKAVFRSGKGAFFRKSALLLQGTLLDAILTGFSLARAMVISLEVPAFVEQQFLLIGSLMEKKKPENIHLINGKIFELLSFLSEKNTLAPAFPDPLNRACRYLEMNPSDNILLPELALLSGCSVSTLQRHFRKYCRQTVYEYRRDLRLHLAQNLLKNTTLSIKEIAARIGYADQAYFSNDFKKHSRLSPQAWRQENSRSA